MFVKIVIFVVIFVNIHAAITPLKLTNDTVITPQAFASALNKNYKLEYFAKANWYNAYLSCLNCGMKLATINSQEEQTAVEQLITAYGLTLENFWIAGTDIAAEGRFSWFTTGDIFKYSNWQPNQPDNWSVTLKVVENCVEITKDNFKWNDWACAGELYFICETNFGC